MTPGGLSLHSAIYFEFIEGATIQVSLTESHEPFESKKSPLAGGRRGDPTQAGLGGLSLPVLAGEMGPGEKEQSVPADSQQGDGDRTATARNGIPEPPHKRRHPESRALRPRVENLAF